MIALTSTIIGTAALLPGCYVDSRTARLLPTQICLAGGCAQLTREWCGAQCAALNYSIAGVKAGHECCCGNALPTSAVRVASSECKVTCTGDDGETCGGNVRLWAFHAPPPPGLPLYRDSRCEFFSLNYIPEYLTNLMVLLND